MFNFFQNKRKATLILVIFVVLFLCAGGFRFYQGKFKSKADTFTKSSVDASIEPKFVSNQIIIRLSDAGKSKIKVSSTRSGAVSGSTISPKDTGITQLDKINTQFNVTKIENTIQIPAANRSGSSDNLGKWYTITFSGQKKSLSGSVDRAVTDISSGKKKLTMAEVLAAYHSDSVEVAQPNFIYLATAIPNDSYFSSNQFMSQGDLWGLKNTNASAAWDKTQGNNTVVAVVDTGVDYNHPDLKNNILKDATGKIVGYNAFSADGLNPMDDAGHGTHVAGIIAAEGNNDPSHNIDSGTRVIGVGPQLKIMPIKGLGLLPDVCGDEACGGDDTLIPGMLYAVKNGARVINNSWGGNIGYQGDPYMAETLEYIHSQNVVTVFASGNDGSGMEYTGEAGDPNVVTVGAANSKNQLACFSNYGTHLDVVAPGGDVGDCGGTFDYILSTALSSIKEEPQYVIKRGSYYVEMMGTSMAAPFVSGAAGLILAAHPDYSNEEVRFALRNSASTLGGGWNPKAGFGLLDVNKAVNLTSPPPVAYIDLKNNYYATSKFDIKGKVSARNGVKNWTLSYGAGDSPVSWMQLNSGTTSIDGLLGQFPGAKGDKFILKLTVTDQKQQISQTYADFIYDDQIMAGWPVSPGLTAVSVQPAVADLGNNGQNEIIVPTTDNNGNAELNILKSDGIQITHFTFPDTDIHNETPSGALLKPSGFTSPVIADINGDGKPEIIIVAGSTDGQTNQSKGKLWVFKYDGKNLTAMSGFPAQITPLTDTTKNPDFQYFFSAPTIADIDGDGQMEILLSTSEGRIFAYRNNGQLLPGWPVVTSKTNNTDLYNQNYSEGSSVQVADMGKNGKNEIFAVFPVTNNLGMMSNYSLFGFDYSGKLLPGWPQIVSPDAINTENYSTDKPMLNIADINNDGQKELLSTLDLGYINPSSNDSDHFFSSAWKTNGQNLWKVDSANLGYKKAFGMAFQPILASLSKGFPLSLNIPTVNYTGNSYLYGLDKDGRSLANLVQNFSFGRQPSMADLNNDGLPEFVGEATDGINTYKAVDNSGKVIWSKKVPYTFSLFTPSLPTIADIDGDGKLEIIIALDGPNPKDLASDGTELYDSMMYVWKTDFSAPKNSIIWGQDGGNAQHNFTFPASATPKSTAPVPVANVFTSANYTGSTAVFALGNYTDADIAAKGIVTKSIQSLKVVGGNILIAYDGDNFTGNRTVWDRNTLLTALSWSKKIVSFKVQKNNNPVVYPAIVYTGGGFDGSGAALKVGSYNAAALTALGIGPKTISSVAFVTKPDEKAVSGYSVKLFSSDNFKGASIDLNSAVYDLSKAPINFNDKTMSLQVCQGTVCQ